MHRFAVFFSSLVILVAAAPSRADPGDYLEIYPTQLRASGMAHPITVEEGQQVLLYCDWTVTASNADRQWYAGGKEHRIPVRILVDDLTVGSFEGVLGPRTRIGNAGGSRGFSVNGESGPASWTAKDPGAHQAVCVVNEPKAVSDQWPQNNTTDPITIRVTSRTPPAKATRKRPQTHLVVLATAMTVVEAEATIPTATVSGGYMVRQNMAEYGTGWGGDAQLFWRPPMSAGSKPHLLTEFVLTAAGTYDLVLFHTTAPDFAQFTVYIDGRKSLDLNAYAPQVALAQVSLGRYNLEAGQHELAFEVTGKSQQSTDYVVGIDRLQLTPVP